MNEEKSAYLELVMVDESYRGMGLFQKMLDEIIQKLQGNYSSLVTIVSPFNSASLSAFDNARFKPFSVTRAQKYYRLLLVKELPLPVKEEMQTSESEATTSPE